MACAQLDDDQHTACCRRVCVVASTRVVCDRLGDGQSRGWAATA